MTGSRLNCYRKAQGHRESSYKWYVPPISPELLVLFQINAAWLYIITGQSVLWEDWIVMFGVRVTPKVYNLTKMFWVMSPELPKTFERKHSTLMHRHEETGKMKRVTEPALSIHMPLIHVPCIYTHAR